MHMLLLCSVRTHAGGYMPAIGMDMGPIAFRKWLKKFAGGGPQMTKMNEGLDGEPTPCNLYACCTLQSP